MIKIIVNYDYFVLLHFRYDLCFGVAEFLEPYKPRPETSAAVARNLVANALGLKTRVPKEKRDEERKKLKEAKGNLNV